MRGHQRTPSRRRSIAHRRHASRNPLKRFQQGFERCFDRLARRAIARCCRCALGRPKTFIAGFLACVVRFVRLWPFLGENFFPAVDSGQILMHVRAQPGTRIEETARLFDQVEQTVRADHSARSARQHRRQYRPAVQRHQHGLSEHRHDRPGGRRRAYQPERRSRPTADYVKRLRTVLPQKFPGATFSFLPADIVSQILNFGLPAPIDVQVIGNNQKANYAYATDLLKRIRHGARHRRLAHPAGVQLSADQCRRRSHACRPRSA